MIFIFLQNTRETAQAVKHMHLRRAIRYLKNVKGKKEIVPFRRFNGGVGRHAQVTYFSSLKIYIANYLLGIGCCIDLAIVLK